MMIRRFTDIDLDGFEPNEFSTIEDVRELLTGRYQVQTQIVDHRVRAFIVFRNYHGRCWSGFLLLCAGYTLQWAREVKAFLHQAIADLDAVRFQTESLAVRKIQVWHKWLGFAHEGLKRKFINDCDYDCWAIVKQGA